MDGPSCKYLKKLQRIEPEIPGFMGPVFERICAQWIMREAKAGKFDVMPAAIGRWWEMIRGPSRKKRSISS